MELTITLSGNPQNPDVTLGKEKRKAIELYARGPLMAFLISIPHCIYLASTQLAESKKEDAELKVVARYKLDPIAMFAGNYVFERIVVEICAAKCDEEFAKWIAEGVKENCPIYQSMKEKMEIVYEVE
ncbi:MAG: OsmC family peroxiredoxin [Candidatus Aramenus sp.]|nr:OsmC family peroxiredoxin [Candidatus Aramenus sp.]